MIPVIETERLMLRAGRASDFPAAAAFLTSDRARYMGGPYTEIGAWRIFCTYFATWALQGFGYWIIEERETADIAGAVGFIGSPPFPELELGWELYDAGFEGRGYATEAARAARDWAFGPAGFSTLVSYVDPGNTASMRVAERLGATRDERAPRLDRTDIVFRHPRPEAPA